MKQDRFDLEGELRASRPQPHVDFARDLADEVRSRPSRERSPLARIGLALALSGLIVVALASFGGVAFASSAASQAVKNATTKHVQIVSHSAAAAQYGRFKPPKAKPDAHAQAAKSPAHKAAPQVVASQLPFTGLALWVPLTIGLLLIAFGLVLRTRGRQHSSDAH